MCMPYFSKREQICNTLFDHDLYGIRPKESFSKNIATINDDLPNRIITGILLLS